MMNSESNNSSRIIIGVGMAVVFGGGVALFATRAHHETEVARVVAASPAAQTPLGPTSPDQTATDPASNTAPATPDQAASAQTPAAPAIAEPAPPVSTPAPVAPAPVAKADRHVAKSRANTDSSSTSTRVASASSNSTSSNSAPSSSESTPSSDSAPAANTQEASTTSAPAVTDSQITSEVKSKIASNSPGTTVDVTTTNGMVALAGSVPNADAVAQVKQVAEQVRDVKGVDTSGLIVSNIPSTPAIPNSP